MTGSTSRAVDAVLFGPTARRPIAGHHGREAFAIYGEELKLSRAFEPSQTRQVTLVPFDGKGEVYSFWQEPWGNCGRHRKDFQD
jgi:hypothetical protein